MNVEELLEKYKAGERKFQKINLKALDLKGADLNGIDLESANLTGCDSQLK